LNPGGEPERDDTGLPPVDIEIPDDARELDRDVQAYLREQRAERRRKRRTWLTGSLASDGIVLPLLACCLILAMITGTLLAVFTATSDQGLPGRPGTPGAASAAPGTGRASSPARSTIPAGQPVTPAGKLHGTLAGSGGRPIELSSLKRVMLILVPAKCGCVTAITQLAHAAVSAGATPYLVSAAGTATEVSRLADQAAGQLGHPLTVAVDTTGVLARYQHGLSAVVVGPDRSAALAGNLTAGQDFTALQAGLAR
jgi:hypothetical protein